jgi:hypothetical protein
MKENLNFFTIVPSLKCNYDELTLMLGFQIRIGLDPDQVGSGSFRLDPDPSRSYGSSRCDGNSSCGKSAGSEIPDFTSMEALLYGL